MGNKISPTDSFEEVLERGRTELSAAREKYKSLEQTETISPALVEAISALERELDELDQTLDVEEADLKLAQQTVRRIGVLNDIFAALRERQRTIVEADVSRLGHQVSSIATLVRDHGIASELDRDIDDIEREYSMLDALVSKGRHEKVLTNDRVSPEGVDGAIQEIDSELAEQVPDHARVDAYETITESLLDEIQDVLDSLGEENSDRTAYSSDLRLVKERFEAAATGEDDVGTSATKTARIALEEALTLHYSTARSDADQRVAGALADAIEDSDLVVDCDVESCVSRGDTETLLTAITAAMGTEAELSTSERLRQLLTEHDGSVRRTARATDFDVGTILDHVERLYDEGQIADLDVTFEQ